MIVKLSRDASRRDGIGSSLIQSLEMLSFAMEIHRIKCSVDEQFFHHRNACFKNEIRLDRARTRKRVRFFLSRKERKSLGNPRDERRRKKIDYSNRDMLEADDSEKRRLELR